MTFIAVNTKIAGITKNDLVYGGFKLLKTDFGTIKQVVWEKGHNGQAKAKRDENEQIVKKEITGFTMWLSYRSQSKQWIGSLVADEHGEQLPKSCLRIEVPLPKQLNTQSKLYELLVMLGELTPIVDECITEEDLLEDSLGDLTEGDLTEGDLLNDNDIEEIVTIELTIDDVRSVLTKYINSLFLAPFTLNENGYPLISSKFSQWELKSKK
jgi:hypothetical protein